MTTSTVHSDQLEQERLAYQWYHDYDQWMECDPKPWWNEDMISYEYQEDLFISDASFENGYVRSDTFVNLTDMV